MRSRILLCLLFTLLSTFISSCESKKESSQICTGKPGTGTIDYSTCVDTSSPKSTPSNSPSPVAYDVICFPQSGLFVSGIKCQPENIFKIPRGTKVTAYLKTVTSVQSGSNVTSYFKTNGNQEKISVSEMESLSSNDAKIYVIESKLGGNFDLYAIRVLLFNKNSGKFDVFAQGGFQKSGEDTSEFIFTSGDTDIRYIPNSIPEAPSPGNNYSPTQNSTHPSAVTFVEIYYRLLNERNYKNAWSRLSTNFQRKSQDYKQWWDKVKSIKIDSIQNVSQNDNAAIVDAKITYELKDGRLKKDESKRIYLTWNKTKNEWEIDK